MGALWAAVPFSDSLPLTYLEEACVARVQPQRAPLLRCIGTHGALDIWRHSAGSAATRPAQQLLQCLSSAACKARRRTAQRRPLDVARREVAERRSGQRDAQRAGKV